MEFVINLIYSYKFLILFMYIRITHTVILDDPFPDPPGLDFPVHSPEPSKEMLDVNIRIQQS